MQAAFSVSVGLNPVGLQATVNGQQPCTGTSTQDFITPFWGFTDTNHCCTAHRALLSSQILLGTEGSPEQRGRAEHGQPTVAVAQEQKTKVCEGRDQRREAVNNQGTL